MKARTFRKITSVIFAITPVLLSTDNLRGAEPSAVIDAETVRQWSAPYRGWHYHPNHVILAKPEIKGFPDVKMTDVPTVYQVPGDGKFHMTFFFFGVGKGGAHIMAAFSRDLIHWAVDSDPLYKAGGNPSGLDMRYAHKISLVWNPANNTYYMFYCAVGNQGRGIGLITSQPLVDPQPNKANE